MAADPKGNIVFRDAVSSKSQVIDIDDRLKSYVPVAINYGGLAFGSDGRAYITDTEHSSIVDMSAEGSQTTVVTGISGGSLLVTSEGLIYIVEPGIAEADSGKLWLVRPNGEKLQLDTSLDHPTGIAISPDGLWLSLAEKSSHWGYSYRIQPDGTVQQKQRFFWLQVPDTADDSGAGTSAMDRDGRLYVATRMGVQVLDHNGRVRAIIPVPGGEALGLSFGGSGFDSLFVSCADHKIYRRKLKVSGWQPWSAPIKVPNWGPG